MHIVMLLLLIPAALFSERSIIIWIGFGLVHLILRMLGIRLPTKFTVGLVIAAILGGLIWTFMPVA